MAAEGRGEHMDVRELYSVEEARFLLGGISRATIYELMNAGELESVTIGRRRLIPAAAINTFIATSSSNIAPAEQRAVGRPRSVQMALQLDFVSPRRSRRRGRSSREDG